MTIEQYLEKVGEMTEDEYGQMVRARFKDMKGTSELNMLVCPSREEFEQLKAGVAIMTSKEKENIGNLSDEQILKIAEDAKIDPAIFAIFINGYALEKKD